MLLSGCFLDRSSLDGPDDGSPGQGLDAASPERDGGRDATMPDATMPDAQTGVDAFVPIEACVPAPEVCDGIDNDCSLDTIDGSADPMVGMACDGDDDDLCQDGILVCTGGALVCVEETPNRDETCNGLDDDCDGRIDEDAGCPCTHHIEGGHSYLFCREGNPNWDDANAFCVTHGYALVTIDDEAEQRWVRDRAQEVSNDKRWWIGARRAAEGHFVWPDGSRLDAEGVFTNWKPSEPNNQWGTENCAEMEAGAQGRGNIPGGWNDEGCWADRRFVCESSGPLPP